jgi:hypothetical protein
MLDLPGELTDLLLEFATSAAPSIDLIRTA